MTLNDNAVLSQKIVHDDADHDQTSYRRNEGITGRRLLSLADFREHVPERCAA